jgi:hypothetical protein
MSYSRKRKQLIRIVKLKIELESDIEEMKEILSMKDGRPKLNAIARSLSKEPPNIKVTDDNPQCQAEDGDAATSESTKGHRKSDTTLRL